VATAKKPGTTTIAHPRLLIAGGVIVVVIIAIMVAARFWTEVLWYRSVGASDVYFTRLVASLVLLVVFGVLMGVGIGINIWVAQRMHASARGVHTPWPLRRAAAIIPAVVIGFFAGMSATSHADMVLAFLNRTPFGQTDPYFGIDLGFYVFSLPWWQYVCAMLMTTLVIGGIAAALAHLVIGSIRQSPIRVHQPSGDGATAPDFEFHNPFGRSAQAHLSVMVGLILVVLGVQSLLARYAYSYSGNGLFTGINYTDDHSRIIARLVIAIIAFICAVVFFVNAFLRRWPIAVSAVVLMIVSSLVIAVIYPMAVQRFFVKPDEPIVEKPYIANHITATRDAYGVENTQITDYSAQTTTSAGQLKADAEALPGIRLMDPTVIAQTFEQLQQVRGYYSFPPTLNVDRYTINGHETDAIVAAREIDQSGMPDQSWNNVHTVFTHGFGMVAAYGNQRQANGEPSWIVGDIPPTGAITQTQPRIYFGERTNTYAIVGAPAGAAPVELDTPGGGTSSNGTLNTYEGTGGVPVGGAWHRLLYAVRFTDLNLLLSDRVNPASKILYDRTPAQRVAKVAPWLTVDSSPFPAVVNGRIVWILDGYTTSDRYPNSQQTTMPTPAGASAYGVSGQQLNYIRNSVKATVDALDGTVTLYAWDPTDPILQTWEKTYPGLLQPKSAISPDLLSHLRYPTDLFSVQRQILGRYHTTDPNTWYQQSDLWQVPNDPVSDTTQQQPPYYLSIKWPGDSDPVFSQTSVYVPSSRQNLGAFLAVVADASSPDYGKIRALKLSDTQQISGPSQAFNAIKTDQDVADQLLPFTTNGSATAIYGNLLTLPLGGGLIYVQPIYTQNNTSGGTGSYPVLRFVAAMFGNQIGIGDTLQSALNSVFGGDAGASTGEEVTPSTGGDGSTSTPPATTQPSTAAPTTGAPSTAAPSTGAPATSAPTGAATPSTPQQQAQADLQAASAAFDAAQTALKNGDLATYQSQIAIAQQKVAAAQSALG